MGSFGQMLIDKSRGHRTSKQRAADLAASEAAKEPDLLMPDEDALLREAKRRLARRGGGRASTILSQRSGGSRAAKASKADKPGTTGGDPSQAPGQGYR